MPQKNKQAQVVLEQDLDKNKLFGAEHSNLKRLAAKIGVTIKAENNTVTIINGTYKECQTAKKIIEELAEIIADGGEIANDLIDKKIDHVMSTQDPNSKKLTAGFNGHSLRLKNKEITPRKSQEAYLKGILEHTISFGCGDAGTGKTYIAVAAAVDAFERGDCKKIIICRPAVEAGEKLGFLPGDQKDKVDPYMRPIYDALDELLPNWKNMVGNTLEIAPLGFMRGRTLKDAFVLLDEAQNTTEEQMKMFLTRLGPGSKMVITGDPSQTDLPEDVGSGLVQAVEALEDANGIYIHHFTSDDVVRHEMVTEVLKGYERLAERKKAEAPAPKPDAPQA